MSKLEARKVEDISFEIGAKYDGILWKLQNGSIYLSLSNLLLTDGTSWYDVPIHSLENISVIQEDPLKIQLSLPSIVILLTGGNADRLLALRHLLMPYLNKEVDEDVKSLLKLWHLGIKNKSGIKMLLSIDEPEISRLISEAKNRAFIDNDDNLTKLGYDMFSDEEKKLLKEVVDE